MAAHRKPELRSSDFSDIPEITPELDLSIILGQVFRTLRSKAAMLMNERKPKPEVEARTKLADALYEMYRAIVENSKRVTSLKSGELRDVMVQKHDAVKLKTLLETAVTPIDAIRLYGVVAIEQRIRIMYLEERDHQREKYEEPTLSKCVEQNNEIWGMHEDLQEIVAERRGGKVKAAGERILKRMRNPAAAHVRPAADTTVAMPIGSADTVPMKRED